MNFVVYLIVANSFQCLPSLSLSQNVSLVYASSSSVYGQDASLPFSISSHPHPPTNMYAALKVANERFANAYCSEHGLKAIGLRLFTVYGPWGRPDMAVYKFTERIANGRPVPVFNSSRPLLRDFTFVNDTVGGVLVALDHTPSCCGEVYNVGSGRPLTLDRMLELLEQELKLPAKIVSQTMISNYGQQIINLFNYRSPSLCHPRTCTAHGRTFLRPREYLVSLLTLHWPRDLGNL